MDNKGRAAKIYQTRQVKYGLKGGGLLACRPIRPGSGGKWKGVDGYDINNVSETVDREDSFG